MPLPSSTTAADATVLLAHADLDAGHRAQVVSQREPRVQSIPRTRSIVTCSAGLAHATPVFNDGRCRMALSLRLVTHVRDLLARAVHDAWHRRTVESHAPAHGGFVLMISQELPESSPISRKCPSIARYYARSLMPKQEIRERALAQQVSLLSYFLSASVKCEVRTVIRA